MRDGFAMGGVNLNINLCERLRIQGAASIDANFAHFKLEKSYGKKVCISDGMKKHVKVPLKLAGVRRQK